MANRDDTEERMKQQRVEDATCLTERSCGIQRRDTIIRLK